MSVIYSTVNTIHVVRVLSSKVGNEYTVNFVNLHVLLKLLSFSRTLIVIDCRLRLLLFPIRRVK